MPNFNNSTIFDNFITGGIDKNSNEWIEVKKSSNEWIYRYQFIEELCQAIDFTPIFHLTEIRQAVETIYREEFKHNGFWKIKEGKVNVGRSGGRFFEKEEFANFSQHISVSEIENLIKNMEKQYKKNTRCYE